MLQQTQVKTVLPYWARWMRVLPTIRALARAKPEKLHKLWEGLGYYTRVRNMQKAARMVVSKHGGHFPSRFEDVLELPGIGRYTAGAICSIAFGQPKPILDGNVIRVLTRVFGIGGDPRGKEVNATLWRLAEELVQQAAGGTGCGGASSPPALSSRGGEGGASVTAVRGYDALGLNEEAAYGLESERATSSRTRGRKRLLPMNLSVSGPPLPNPLLPRRRGRKLSEPVQRVQSATFVRGILSSGGGEGEAAAVGRQIAGGLDSAERRVVEPSAASSLNQGLMELGALVCTPRQPRCGSCPVVGMCVAYQEGRTEELPALRARAAATARRFVAFVVEKQGRILVRQRPEGVVNAHLWEFPNIEVTGARDEIRKSARRVLGVSPKRLKRLCSIKHTITRYRITLEAYYATEVDGIGKRHGFRWLARAELKRRAFSSAHGKLRSWIDGLMD
jgi:adenine-specific DNA glycosylase